MCRIDDLDGSTTCYTATERTARKAHICSECWRAIEPGERYQHVFALVEGEPDTQKTCEHCLVGQRWLLKNCGGYVFGQICEEIEEHAGEYPALRAPLEALATGSRRKWRRFDGGAMMGLPALPPSIESVVRETPMTDAQMLSRARAALDDGARP